MEEAKEGVETKDQPAPTDQGVKTSVAPAPGQDPEATIKALQEELNKVASDRDNYRTAVLGKKGKIEPEELDLTDPVQLKAYVDRNVEERLLATREAQARKELEEHTLDMARKLKEVTLALANKNQMVSTGGGSGSTGLEPKRDDYLSEEQISALKAKGWDDEKIKRFKETARRAKT